MRCRICNNDKDYKRLGPHLRQAHNLDTEQQQDYYDKYLKKKGEGVCLECGKPTKYWGLNRGYRQFCSVQCATGEVMQKRKEEIMLERYGHKYSWNIPEVQEKIKQTNLERYGVENAMFSEVVKKKVRETNMEKYGVPVSSQSPIVKEKAKQTNLERYGHLGVTHPTQLEEVKEKMANTNMKKYGGVAPACSEEVQLKMKNTNLQRYGTEFYIQSKEGKDAVRKSNQERYGVDWTTPIHIDNFNDWENLKDFIEKYPNEFDCMDLCEYFNVYIKTLRYKLRALEVEHLVKDFYTMSMIELEFKNKLEKELPDVVFSAHDRRVITPLELDFYFPDYNLAVEVSPTFTHKFKEINKQYGKPGKDYHYKKFKACEEKGIELVTLFEWEDTDLVFDLLKSKLACKTKVVDIKDCKLFISSSDEGAKQPEKYYVVEIYYLDNNVGIVKYTLDDNNTLRIIEYRLDDGIRITDSQRILLREIFDTYSEIQKIVAFSDNNLGLGQKFRDLGFCIEKDNVYPLNLHNAKKDILVRQIDVVTELDNINPKEAESQMLSRRIEENSQVSLESDKLDIVYDCGYRMWAVNKEDLINE